MEVDYTKMQPGWAPSRTLLTSTCPVCNRVCVEKQYSISNVFVHTHLISRSDKGNNVLRPVDRCRVTRRTGKVSDGPRKGMYLVDGALLSKRQWLALEKKRMAELRGESP